MRTLRHALLHATLTAAAAFAATGPARAATPQGDDLTPTELESTSQEEALPAEPEPAPSGVTPPATVAEAIEASGDLGSTLEDASDAEARALLDAYMSLARQQRAAIEEVAGAPEGSPEANAAAQLRADLDTLVSSAERIAARLTERGADVAGVAEEIAGLRANAEQRKEAAGAPSSREVAIAMDLEVLRARLRPLFLAEIEARIEPWKELLHSTCLEISDVETASLTAQSDEDVTRYQERAVLLRQERAKLIDRVRVVLDAAEEKGGDVAESRAYLRSVVAAPAITGLRAAMTTAVTWLKSPDGGIAVLIAMATAIAIVFAAVVLSRLLGRLARRGMKSFPRASHLLRDFVVAAVKRGVVIIGLLVALSTLGVNMGPLLAAIGAAGLVIGLALQGTLGNLASGLMIMVFRPFDVDDVVETGGTSGKVAGLSLMTTEIRTFDNRTIYVPNNRIWGDVITNVTANATRRVDMKFGISYGDDAAKAREIAEGVLADHPKILSDPAPMVRVHELADSSVNLIVRPWSRTSDYWDVYWDITAQMKDAFDANDITIPFPQRDVHMIPPVSGGGAATPPSETSGAQQEAAT